MKKLAVLLTVLLVPVFAMAQVSSIDKLINKYSGQDGVTVVNISPELFQIMSGMNIEDVEDVDFPLDKLTAVKVLAIESEEVLQGADFYAEVTENLNTSDYAEIISVKDGDEDVKMWLKADGTNIKECL
ncbi:MAG: DUF4252 domain-containing protein [Bacteroidales bacterium]|jgi:hypothetical protein|nr:DUF4252 domain-containing protein [Bacteroidales bacterium]